MATHATLDDATPDDARPKDTKRPDDATPDDATPDDQAIRFNFYGGDMPEAESTSVDWKPMDEETPREVTRPWAPQHADEPDVDVDAAGRPKQTP